MIIAVTGHRPDKLGGYGQDVFSNLVSLFEDYLQDWRSISTHIAITGMALGWDQAVAQACINEGVPFIAAVPFKGQESKWPKESQTYYRWLLEQAREVVTVCGGGYSPDKMQRRNMYMVDRADKVVALWNESPGGTKNCVDYAKMMRRPVENLWSEWMTRTARHEWLKRLR